MTLFLSVPSAKCVLPCPLHLLHLLRVQVLEEDGCQQRSAEVGTYFIEQLSKLRDEFPIVGDVRGKGLMIGMEMVADKVGRNASITLRNYKNVSRKLLVHACL